MPAGGVSRCSIKFFDGYDLSGRLGRGGKIYQQFLPLDEQQEHLAELQEINAEQVLYIQEMSHEASGPKDNCAIYFANDKSIYLHGRTASSVANLLSSK